MSLVKAGKVVFSKCHLIFSRMLALSQWTKEPVWWLCQIPCMLIPIICVDTRAQKIHCEQDPELCSTYCIGPVNSYSNKGAMTMLWVFSYQCLAEHCSTVFCLFSISLVFSCMFTWVDGFKSLSGKKWRNYYSVCLLYSVRILPHWELAFS